MDIGDRVISDRGHGVIIGAVETDPGCVLVRYDADSFGEVYEEAIYADELRPESHL